MKVEKELLEKLFEFHGHKCWASVLGLRAGLIALKKLNVQKSKARELYCIIEVGFHHGAMCFADGVQYATGCTFGKGNLIRKPRGKLAFTLIDWKKGKQIRICFNSKMRSQIAQTIFMKKRGMGIPPSQIPEEEALEVVNLILNAKEEDILIIGKVEDTKFSPPEEPLGLIECEICKEPVARPYIRILGDKKVCIDCAGYTEGFEKCSHLLE